MGTVDAGVVRAERPRKYKFIGCEILYREACWLAAMSQRQVDVEFLKKGLHDLERGEMLARVQAAVDAADATGDYEAILLGYARCNDGVVGLRARTIPLVIPRAHDCITLFLGSRAAFQADFDRHPGTYYMTSGWFERAAMGDYSRPAYGQEGVMGKLGLAQTRAELIEKYGEENAEYIESMMGDWLRNYSRLAYVKMGVGPEEEMIRATTEEAGRRGWTMEVKEGNWGLLKKLFEGRWDEDFVVVRPGQKLAARNDEGVLGAE